MSNHSQADTPITEPHKSEIKSIIKDNSIPFLSIVMRTQGKRIHTLRDALLCLTAQSNQNFEILVIGHKLSKNILTDVQGIISELPEQIKSKVTLYQLNSGGRASPLNLGFSKAKGQYISIFDDDDLVMANWVETFESLARQNDGKMLRAIAVKQNCTEVVMPDGLKAVKFTDSPIAYLPEFHLFDHLNENHSPCHSLAFPRRAYHDLGIHFSEELSTAEDWEFLLRVALVCGYASKSEVTSIYRWWTDSDSSRSEHYPAEWARNRQIISDRIDQSPAILLPGMVGDIRRLVKLVQETGHLPIFAAANLAPLNDAKTHLRRMLASSSWRSTAMLRSIGRRLGKGAPRIKLVENETNVEVIERQIQQVRHSFSWRLTAPFRSGGRGYE